MKQIKLLILVLSGAFSVSTACGQANAYINILTLNSGQVILGQTVDVQVDIGATLGTGGQTGPIPVNKVRAQISIPSIASALPSVQQTGLPAGWSILSNSGSAITICNGTDVIPVGEQRTILIKIQGNSVGGPSTIVGQLSFGPGTGVCTGPGTLNGDNTVDNNSTTTIQVIPATVCTLGITASAGAIACNGGTTTLTATDSGANGSVEYSLTGGVPFQSGNTFTVSAGTYSVTVREVINTTCTATTTPVTVTDPAIVPAPTASVVQPTCTVANGTITITSSTTGLTFSLDGGAYVAYPPGGYSVAAGTHTLIAKNGNGCLSTVTNVTVNAQPPSPSTPTTSVVQPTCTVATGTITITNSTIGLTFSLDGGAYTSYPVGGYTVSTGGHSLTAQNSNACISPVTFVTVNTQPATPAAPTTSVVQPTCTVATGTINITSSTTGLTFSLDGGSYTSYSAGGYTVNAGAHTLTAQNASNCISPVTNITVNAQPVTPAAPTASVVQPTCNVSTGTITISSSATGLTFSFDGGSYATYPPGGYSAATGLHTLTAMNGSGCISTVTNVTVSAQPVTPTAPTIGTITQPTCAISTGSVVLNGLPAGNWTVNPGAVNGNTSSVTINSLAQGTYNFTVTNNQGCTSAASGNVVINGVPGAPPAPTVNVIEPTCTVATGTIAVTSSTTGSTFSLDGGAYAPYPAGGYTVTAGSHTLTLQNAASCISPITYITVDAQPVTPASPTATVTQPTCTVSTGIIIITSNTTGLIFSLDGGAYGVYPVGGYMVATGIHTLTAQNGSGCISGISNVTVNVQPVTPSAPTIGAITQPTCSVSTGSVVLNGLVAGNWTITSNPGGVNTTGSSLSTTISNLSPGTYTFTITNDQGCTSLASGNVVISSSSGPPTAPTASVVQPSCTVSTGIISITSSTTGLTFSLDGGAYAAYPVGGYIVAAGPHTLTAKNASGCISTVTNVTVNAQPPTPSAPVTSIVQPTCTEATGTITITSATTGLTFSLDGGAYTTYPAGGYTVSSGTHTLTAQNSNFCISAVTTITVNAQPATPAPPSTSVTQPTCTVATGIITITSSTTGLTFSLDGGAYTTYPAGGYTVAIGTHTLTAQNTSTCISSVTNVTVNAQPPTPTAPTTSVIQPTCAVATGIISITSSTTGLTFSLDGGAFAAYPAGGYTVIAGTHTLNAQNSNGCISTAANVTVNVQPLPPTAAISVGAIPCFGGTTTLTVTATGGTPPYQYSLNGGTFQSGNMYTVGIGTYSVTVKGANLCSYSTTPIIISQPTAITAVASTGSIGCNGETTTLTATATGGTPPYQYSVNGGAYQSGNTFTVNAGIQTVTVRDANGCTKTASAVTVTQPTALTIMVDAPRITHCGGTTVVTITASGGRTPYTGVGSFTKGPGSWTFHITEANGCTDSAKVDIEAPGCMDIRVYPNPAKTLISINHTIAEPGAQMQVFDITGALVISRTVPANAFLTTIDISNLAAGPYVMVYINGKDKKAILFEKISY